MHALLLVFLLNVQGSYLQDIEKPATDEADTVQFILLHGQAWRIKTFAIDHDVHVWHLGPMDRKKFEALADGNTQRHYGDVLVRKVTVEAADDTTAALKSALKASGLAEQLEVPKDDAFAFWVPKANAYRTRSTPESMKKQTQ
jgi:hypothetical protein